MASDPNAEWKETSESNTAYIPDDVFGSESITIYCRTRKTMKKGTGGVITLGAGIGTAALVLGTGGLAAPIATATAAPLYAAGAAAGGVATFGIGSGVTGYMVNPRVYRMDFDNPSEADEAFEKIGTYKIMIRDNAIVKQKGKQRWIAELIGSAVTDSSENGPGLTLETPTQEFSILRSPMTYGSTQIRVKTWAKFNIKQYTTDSAETADAKWKKLGRASNAVYISGTSIEKTYGRKSFVNELIGWYVLARKFGGDDKETIKTIDLDNE